MIEHLTQIGLVIDQLITLMGLTVLFLIRFVWQCGICGKINETGLLRFVFCMCDHEGTNQH